MVSKTLSKKPVLSLRRLIASTVAKNTGVTVGPYQRNLPASLKTGQRSGDVFWAIDGIGIPV